MADKQDEILSEIKVLGKTCAAIDERTEAHTVQLAGIHTNIGSLRERTAVVETEVETLKGTVGRRSGVLGAISGGGVVGLVAALKAFFSPGN